MSVRAFTVSGERILLSGGALGALVQGSYSSVALIKPLDVSVDNSWYGVSAPASGLPHLIYHSQGGMYHGGDLGDVFINAGISANDWQVIGESKVAGSSIPRMHRKVLGSGSWTHANASGSLGGSSETVNGVIMGDWASLGCNQRVAFIAYFDKILSDTDFADIESNHTTAFLDSLGPIAGWELNQTVVSDQLADWTGGGANQTSRVGTTIVNGDDPVWTFGLGSPPQQARPDADVTTTGWTTVPLWSKVEEDPVVDADFITSTAS